jgi:hypothetical protein
MKPSPEDTLFPWLESREELLWAGRPDPLRMARARTGLALAGSAILLLLFLTPLWQYFTVVPPGTGEALSYNQDDIHLAEAVPFSLFLTGLFLLLQPLAAYYYAGRTTYAVTGKRLLMVRKDMLGTLIKTARYEAIEAPIMNVNAGSTGDIFFFRKAEIPGKGLDQSPLTRFLGVRDAGHVHQLILSRFPVPDGGKRPAEPVQDYLELLVKGQRNLNPIHDRTLNPGEND